MTNPVRNHLQLPGFGSKLGDRLDVTSTHLVDEIRRVLTEYKGGLIVGTEALRELDAVQALVRQQGTALGSRKLPWEGSEVDRWLSKHQPTKDADHE